MPKTTAGLVMCRLKEGEAQVLLVHPGGPYFRRKDEGCWSIPKGLVEGLDEDLLSAAKREFVEETGLPLGEGPFEPLDKIKQKGGKVVHAWAFAGDCDPAAVVSNEFELEWPPKSGTVQSFPEVDRAEWCSASVAARKLVAAQWPLVERALRWIGSP